MVPLLRSRIAGGTAWIRLTGSGLSPPGRLDRRGRGHRGISRRADRRSGALDIRQGQGSQIITRPRTSGVVDIGGRVRHLGTREV